MRPRVFLELALAVVALAIVCPIAGPPQPARAEYPLQPTLVGESYHQYGRSGTLDTSAVFDVTGHPSRRASAFFLWNDGPSDLRVEAVDSVAEMTINSHPVRAGEPYTSPVRTRKYSVTCAPGTTTAYRVFAAW